MQSQSTETTDTDSHWLWRVLVHALWMLCAVMLLFYVNSLVNRVPCWGLFIMLALVAWPIWQYRTEYRLFQRQLLLAGALQTTSVFRKAFWKGGVMRAVQVLVSLLLAWLLLVLLSQLSLNHWLLLALDALLLAFLYRPVTRWFSETVNEQHLGAIVRHWPLFLVNGLLLTVAFVLIDFYLVAVPDTRSQQWNELAEMTFLAQLHDSRCVLWGISSAAAAVFEVLGWHASQVLIPRFPDVAMKLIAWGLFLLRAALVTWLFTAMLLGISSMLERREQSLREAKPWSTFSLAFLLTIILLAVPFLYASMQMQKMINEQRLSADSDQQLMTTPCRPGSLQRSKLDAQLDSDIEATRAASVTQLEQRADEGVAELFADVEQGVDHYLDWYFTVLGEYERLAAVFTADVAESMRDHLYKYLFADSDFDNRLAVLDAEMANLASAGFVELSPQLAQTLADSDCVVDDVSLDPLLNLDKDAFRSSVAAGAGVGAGVVTGKLLASKTTAAVVSKVAAKKSFQTGAVLASKALAKKGSSTLLSAGVGTALCAPTGPVALLCGVTAGLVTWFTVDKVLIELDEVLSRDEMRVDILDSLLEPQAQLSAQLTAIHVERVDRMALQLNELVDRSFVPANQGLGQP